MQVLINICVKTTYITRSWLQLPLDMQQKVRSYVSGKRRVTDGNGNLPPKSEMKTIKVPIPTFPPTAMVYSVNKITAGTKNQGQLLLLWLWQLNHTFDLSEIQVQYNFSEWRKNKAVETGIIFVGFIYCPGVQ